MDDRSIRMINFAFQTAFDIATQNPEHHRIECLTWNDFRADDDLLRQLDVNFRSCLEAGRYLKASDRNLWKELFFFFPDVDRSSKGKTDQRVDD